MTLTLNVLVCADLGDVHRCWHYCCALWYPNIMIWAHPTCGVCVHFHFILF